jgi:hypothetical protein
VSKSDGRAEETRCVCLVTFFCFSALTPSLGCSALDDTRTFAPYPPSSFPPHARLEDTHLFARDTMFIYLRYSFPPSFLLLRLHKTFDAYVTFFLLSSYFAVRR